MAYIDRFDFEITSLNDIRSLKHKNNKVGENWPVVYLLHNDQYRNPSGSVEKLLYVGESTSAARRMKEHFSRSNKNFDQRIKLDEAAIIFDETFNKSAILDIEQELIRMFGADSSNYSLQNRNDGQSTQHQYFERDSYYSSLREIWDALSQSRIMDSDASCPTQAGGIFSHVPTWT